MDQKYVTRKLKISEIYKLKGFAPTDWNFELDSFLHAHFDKSYFLPIVTVKDGEIIAFANALINGNIGWAGNIIVSPSHQKKGLGYAITEELITLMQKQVESILLIATKMGESLYKKFGFTNIESYTFFEYKKIETTTSETIRPFDKKFLEDLLILDYENTLESRRELFEPFLKNAWIYISDTGKLTGFYIQGFGDGTIIASDKNAGKALLEFKHSKGLFRSVIPTSNKIAIKNMQELGIKTMSQANRMILGKDINWKPENIYSRIAGYCG